MCDAFTDGARERVAQRVEMKTALTMALALGCWMAAAPRLFAQDQQSNPPAAQPRKGPPSAQDNQPAAQQPARTQQQTNQNPFPEDTSDVPVVPTGNPPNVPSAAGGEAARPSMPAEDVDPVRTPEEAGEAEQEKDKSSSSSLAGLRDVLPPADDEEDTQPDKHGRKAQKPVPEHHETAAEDENVGKYYLDNKDWKAALSRFQSAMVLDPDNPDVYWGLAEAERHLGNFADARANYLKVTQYDPDSRHGKDARKALQDPEIANAKSSTEAQKPATSQ